jgi:probable O-glycosylation ligase (exosortase A-associated)
MRDVLVTAIVFGSLPVILARPYVGILVWSWLGYMNPQRLSWGFAYDLPFSLCVAVVTLIAVLFSKETKRIPVTSLTVLWLLFIGWMTLTTPLGFYPDAAWSQWNTVMKIQLMTFVTILVMYSRERVRLLVWTIVLSLGYYGVRGGISTILSGGEYHVWGPPETFVAGNNEIALALLMTLPLMQYLRVTSNNRWVRLGLLLAMVLSAFSIVGSQSRGALVGGFAMALLLWIKSRKKPITGAVLLILLPALFAFMPEQWHQRMRTIETYEADTSAMSRIETWRMALRVANDKPMGGGFDLWTQEAFDRYSPDYREPHDAHSIYFKVLGEHGWLGLALFCVIGVLAWRTGSAIIRRTAGIEELRWLSELARMIQVSLAAYATGGAFLSLSYFDLYWHLVALLVLGNALVRQHLAQHVGSRLAGGTAVRIAPSDRVFPDEGVTRIG